jgi:hypothetical protein
MQSHINTSRIEGAERVCSFFNLSKSDFDKLSPILTNNKPCFRIGTVLKKSNKGEKMNERRKTKKEIRAEYERKWTLVMARWLGRFVRKPKNNGDIFVGIFGGEIEIFKRPVYMTDLQISKLSPLAQVKEETRIRMKKFPPSGKRWNPFNDFTPWMGPKGLLKKIRTTGLLNVFLAKLDLSNQLNGIEELFGWLENDPSVLAKLMAEALVEILEEKSLKP